MGNKKPEQSAGTAKKPTFETVWEALLKMEANINAYIEEAEKDRRQRDEALSKMEKTVSDLSKNLGGLGNLQGRLTEAMFEAELWKKFNEKDFFFTTQISHYKFTENRQVVAEVDFFLENGEHAMPVEIKTELSLADIDEHIERITKIRKYMDARGDSRKLAGAVGGEIVPENVLNYAHKKGLYVVTQTGDSVAIAAAPNNFTPREW